MAKLKLDTIKEELYDVFDNTRYISKDYFLKGILKDKELKSSTKREDIIALAKKAINKKKSLAKQKRSGRKTKTLIYG